MFKFIVKLCCFRAAPEDMPYSIPLLLGIVCINFSMLFFIILLATTLLTTALWKSLLLMILIAGFTYIVLSIKQFPERLVQTLSGLYATQTIILVVFALPCVILSWFLLENSSNVIYMSGFVVSGLLILIASLWLFFIYARIFQHSLETSINKSMFVALLLFSLNALSFALLNRMY